MGKIKNFSEYHNIEESQILLEKTFNIESDVDLIYEKGGFSEFLKAFTAGEKPYEDELNSIQKIKHIVFDLIPSSELQTEDCINAHRQNPIDIYTGITIMGSHYSPTNKTIFISLNSSALDVNYSGDIHYISSSQKETIYNEITEQRIKIAIHHELSHWISDSLYNKHIGRIINRGLELQNNDIIKLKQKDVNMTYFEIDAQVHSIKELKRNYDEREWNELSLRDIMIKYPSLSAVYKELKSKHGLDVALLWQKNLTKRLYREGLLGNNMKQFVRDFV